MGISSFAMACATTNDAPTQDTHKEVRWDQDYVGVRTDTGFIKIRHDVKQQKLMFYSNASATAKFESTKSMLDVVMSKSHRVFLEWCQVDTGSYVYFNLGQLVQSLDESTAPHESIDVNLLTLNQNNNSQNDDVHKNDDQGMDEKKEVDEEQQEQEVEEEGTVLDGSYYFDESVPLESMLNSTDILIISPIRSMHHRFTPMGIYEGHQLYLGPLPTVEFVNQCKVSYLMNCCLKGNNPQIMNNVNAKERLFNVGKWMSRNKCKYVPLEKGQIIETLGLNEEEQKNGKSMTPMEFLDAMIDEMHHYLKSGNILVHCLAGAHRSPFITGCYLMKYGLKGTKAAESPENIYVYLKEKRSIVQELGFDGQMKKYQKYLTKQHGLESGQ